MLSRLAWLQSLLGHTVGPAWDLCLSCLALLWRGWMALPAAPGAQVGQTMAGTSIMQQVHQGAFVGLLCGLKRCSLLLVWLGMVAFPSWDMVTAGMLVAAAGSVRVQGHRVSHEDPPALSISPWSCEHGCGGEVSTLPQVQAGCSLVTGVQTGVGNRAREELLLPLGGSCSRCSRIHSAVVAAPDPPVLTVQNFGFGPFPQQQLVPSLLSQHVFLQSTFSLAGLCLQLSRLPVMSPLEGC